MHLQSLHTHSLYDDGHSTLEQMLQSAMEHGLSAFGFSGHSPLPFETDWAIPEDRIAEYNVRTRALQAQYAGTYPVYCGLEWDNCSALPTQPYDYLIGSVHHFPVLPDGRRYNVDTSAEQLRECTAVQYHGDVHAQEDAYYALVGNLADIPQLDIVGHLDLITKFDEPHAIYSEAPQSALRAMERLVRAGKIFEVNTGAISRGYRTTPYPSEPLLRALREMDGKILFTADAHRAQDICCAYEQAVQLAKSCGFTQHWILTAEGFVPESL